MVVVGSTILPARRVKCSGGGLHSLWPARRLAFPCAALLALVALACPAAAQAGHAAADDTAETEARPPADNTEETGSATAASSVAPETELGLLDEVHLLGLFDDLALLAAENYVVSATRHVQPIEQSPAAITVITREQIRQSGYTELIDLMRLVPGADVFHLTRGHLSVGLRSRANHGGDMLLALIDGRDLAPSLSGTPVWAGTPVDIASIERIEIIRGPSSTLYGANALQGVVNIVTRLPGPEPFTAEGDAWVGTPLGHAANVRVHGTRDRFSYWTSVGYDYRPDAGTFQDSKLEAFRGRALAVHRASEEREFSLELGATKMTADLHLVTLGPGTIDVLHPYIRGHAKLGRTEIQLVAEYHDFTMDLDVGLVAPATETTAAQLLGSFPPLNHPTIGLEAIGQHHVEILEGNRLTAGLIVKAIQHLPGAAMLCPKVDFADFDPTECEPLIELEGRAGVFLQDEWQITEWLTFTGGLRLDYNTLTPEPAFSPRAALVWRPSRDHALRASYGRAYRKPTFLQARGHLLLEPEESAPSDLAMRLAYIFSQGVGNREVRNEKADAYELGWRGRFLDGRLVATTDLFHGRYFDAIWFASEVNLESGFGGVDRIPDDAFIQYYNLDHRYPLLSWGGEAVLTFHPTRQLELRAVYGLDYLIENFAAPDAEVPDYQRVVFEPMQRFVGSVRWRPTAALTTSVDLILAGPYEDDIRDPASALLPLVRSPIGKSVTLNASAAYRLELGGTNLEIGATAFNIPDFDIYEAPYVLNEDGHFGADRLSRQLRFFVRGQY